MTALAVVPSRPNRPTNDPLTKAVARVLTRAKEDAGLTFTELGLASGLGRATVVRYLAGERSPQLDDFVPLCRALKVEPTDVIAEAQRIAGWHEQ